MVKELVSWAWKVVADNVILYINHWLCISLPIKSHYWNLSTCLILLLSPLRLLSSFKSIILEQGVVSSGLTRAKWIPQAIVPRVSSVKVALWTPQHETHAGIHSFCTILSQLRTQKSISCMDDHKSTFDPPKCLLVKNRKRPLCTRPRSEKRLHSNHYDHRKFPAYQLQRPKALGRQNR